MRNRIKASITFSLGLTLAAFFLPLAKLDAQSFQGLVVYTEKMIFKPDSAQMADPRYQQMQAMMSNPPSFKKHLRLGESASMYVTDPVELATPIDPEDPAARMKTMMRQESEVYRDFNTGELVEYADFMGKKFLISGDEPRKWKMTTEQRTIAGYPCMKAVATDSLGSTEAWFTTSIPVASGPRSLGGLPGLILEATLRNGRFIVSADTVDFRALTAEEPIQKPEKGKAVTREEYRQIVKDKMKEMQMNGGGGGMMRHAH